MLYERLVKVLFREIKMSGTKFRLICVLIIKQNSLIADYDLKIKQITAKTKIKIKPN